MSEKEMQLAAEMLEALSDKQAMAICNDWYFPDDWTVDEKARFVLEYHEWNGDPEEYDENCLILPDFAVASFLASKLKGERK